MSKPGNRSGKQKRQRMQLHRASRRTTTDVADEEGSLRTVHTEPSHDFRMKGQESDKKAQLQTVFHVREAGYEVEKRINESQQPLRRHLGRAADYSFYREIIDIPERPAWNPRMRHEAVIRNEEEAFERYVQDIYDKYPPGRLNHFEHNVNVWRQLWRVCEQSDVLVLSADARHPLFHFPPSLYHSIVHKYKKPFVLVLNKIDLVSKRTLSRWVDFFRTHFPSVRVVPFTSFPNEKTVTYEGGDESKKRKTGRRGATKARPVGVEELMRVLRELGAASKPHVADAVAPPEPASAPAQGPRAERERKGEAEADAEAEVLCDSAAQADDAESDGEDTGGVDSFIASLSSRSSVMAREDGDEGRVEVVSAGAAPEAGGAKAEARGVNVSASARSVLEVEEAGGGSGSDEDDAEEAIPSELSAVLQLAPRAVALGRKARKARRGNLATAPADGDADADAGDDDFVSDSELLDEEGEEGDVKAKGAAAAAVASAKGTGRRRGGGGSDDEDEEEDFDELYEEGRRAKPRKLDYSKVLTIGMIGHPNAGKSSLVNALLGRAAVSVSSTPGKTKHLQTLQLSENIILCDCPGLVFPAVDMPKVLMNIFPLPQLREPYSSVHYLAERLPLERIYGLVPPIGAGARDDDLEAMEDDPFAELERAKRKNVKDYQWSAWDICVAYAIMKNYRLKGAKGSPDTHRAAQEILRDALDGNIVLNFEPPEKLEIKTHT